MGFRRAARKDENQSEIVETLRALGFSVFVMDEPCDLLLGKLGKNYLIEIKDGAKPPSQRKLTKAQAEFHPTWRGQIAVIKSVQEALEWARGLTLGTI